jgi:hypothetical protein
MATPQRQHYVVRIEEVVRYYYHVQAATPRRPAMRGTMDHLKGARGVFRRRGRVPPGLGQRGRRLTRLRPRKQSLNPWGPAFMGCRLPQPWRPAPCSSFLATFRWSRFRAGAARFCVGTLKLSIGEFKIKDSALDQFEPGLTAVTSPSRRSTPRAPWRGGFFTELIAKIAPDGFLIDDETDSEPGLPPRPSRILPMTTALRRRPSRSSPWHLSRTVDTTGPPRARNSWRPKRACLRVRGLQPPAQEADDRRRLPSLSKTTRI